MLVGKHLNRPQYVIAAFLAVLILIGVVLWLQNTERIRTSSEPITYSTRNPSEGDSGYVSTAGPDDPKIIRLPSIQVEGYVQKVGIDQHQQVAAPTDIKLAGWYVNGAKPGEGGLSIIDGHVDGQYKRGIFYDLSKLKAGDYFEIELGDNSIKQYKILDVITVNNNEAANALFSQRSTVNSQLNLITCGGKFNPVKRLYDQRVIAYSELVE